jgi:hypothetical protein
METLTKKIVVNGEEMVMSSLDGRSWFLKAESMYDFDKRLRDAPKAKNDELEDLEPEPIQDAIDIAD